MRCVSWIAFATLLFACLPLRETGEESRNDGQDLSYAHRLARRMNVLPFDYSDPSLWACWGEPGDACTHTYHFADVGTGGVVTPLVLHPAADTKVDCFFIYPTLDFNIFQGSNHENMASVELPRRVVETMVGPFSEVCRVFAPYYRQGTFGAYMTNVREGADRFRRAFLDVAAAFEWYLEHWNAGRAIVILGHSQGAQMASYLLHAYFDGDVPVTKIAGSQRSRQLRERLIVGLPIGFSVFAPRGKRVGGSFSDLPLCESLQETGCIIHYRSYPEGFQFEEAWGRGADDELAAEGFLYRAADRLQDELACVNPAMGSPVPPDWVRDADGFPILPAEVRTIEGAYFVGVTAILKVGPRTEPANQAYRRRYTATCRYDARMGGNYLAIGLLAAPGEDRADPLALAGSLAQSGFGLHIYDFNLAQRDLIEQVRRRVAWFAP